MKNFDKVSVGDEARTELHDKLHLTGAEISVNHIPAGAGVPFVHYHKKNEEIYFITDGHGKAVIDVFKAEYCIETIGINTRSQLAAADKAIRMRKEKELMEAGITIIDPNTTFIEDTVKIGQDTIIRPNTYIEGNTIIGENTVIGGNSFITASVEPNSKVSMTNLEKENKNDGKHGKSEEVKQGEEWYYII